VVAAVGGLEQDYGDRVDFVIVPAEETAQRIAEVNAFGFAEQRHGLVGFSADGQARVKIPGHQFGRPEIEDAIQRVLE
jgi:hypothetical protein